MIKCIIFSFLFLPFVCLAQEQTLTGQVLNENQQPLAGANLVNKRTGTTTVSDGKGLFTLQLVLLNDTITISAVGYITVEYIYRGQSTLNISLQNDVASLPEVIMSTGYQDIPKERATGAFTR